jgi:UDP-2,3-diacylglucosamine hydrolase
MSDYFLSDVHLRLDRPERGRKLARLVDSLSGDDRITVVGDLCDFWFESRQDWDQADQCPGLSALRAFQQRGGSLRILLGNHDAWLGPFYESFFGLVIDPEPLEVESHGLRLRLEHGHRRKGKRAWKAWMEGRAFFRTFGRLPDWMARALEYRLDSAKKTGKAESDRRMIQSYRMFVNGLESAPDLAIFGHVHQVVDEDLDRSRMVVLGDWIAGASYLEVDDDEARLVVVSAQDSATEGARLDRARPLKRLRDAT